MASAHEWHSGELFVQEKLGYVEAVARAHGAFRPQLTLQHQEFHTSLSLLPICTLDALGRPWGSFLAARDGEAGFISSSSFTNLQAAGLALHEAHPLQEAMLKGAKVGMQGLMLGGQEARGPALKLVAGVGVMFGSRRRNKFSGFINERCSSIETGVTFEVMQTVGNCPKYINTRHLGPFPGYQPKVLAESHLMQSSESLPVAAIEHIAKADTVFLSTRYIAKEHPIFKSHLGINIRGGKAGFVRTTVETVQGSSEKRQVIYFPDYSGNRFMSSLGNIYTDKVAGLTIPLMELGKPIDVLYITGDAEILIDEEASKVFPGVRTAVKIVVTGFTYVQDAVPLRPAISLEDDFEQKDANGVGWSPYNPPVRRLRSELFGDQDGVPSDAPSCTAKVMRLDRHSNDLATVTLQLSSPLKYQAGQHIILDCAALLSREVTEYKHMADKRGGERELNDAGTRTWTISSAPSSTSTPQHSLQITIRRHEDGLITPKLFDLEGKEVQLPVLGIAGSFVATPATQHIWVAQGIGLTPFLAFLQTLKEGDATPNVTFVLALRKTEVDVMLRLLTFAVSAAGPSAKANIELHLVSAALDSNADSSEEQALLSVCKASKLNLTVKKHATRLTSDWLVSNVATRMQTAAAWICGTPTFERVARNGLISAGYPQDIIQSESFSY